MLLTMLQRTYETIWSYVPAEKDLISPLQPGQPRLEVVRSSGLQARSSLTKWQSFILLPEVPLSWRAVRVPPEVVPATRSTHTGRKAVVF